MFISNANKNTCFCKSVEEFLTHSMENKFKKHHSIFIQGKQINLEQLWHLKTQIGLIKMKHNNDIKLNLLEFGHVQLESNIKKMFVTNKSLERFK